MATAVVIMESGGLGVTNLAGATPMTVADNEIGIGITLVENGLPVTLLNEDGSLWSPSPEGYVPTYPYFGF